MLHRLAEKELLEGRKAGGGGQGAQVLHGDGRATFDEIRPKIQELVAEVVKEEGPGSITDEGELYSEKITWRSSFGGKGLPEGGELPAGGSVLTRLYVHYQKSSPP